MFRTDTGNFNRFLTSLGLLLLGGALVIPYFYFRNTEVLEIPARDLDRLTETGRAALTGRQDAVASLESWVLALAVFLAVLGVVLVVLGGLRLRSAQASDDKAVRIRMRHEELDLEKKELSSEERSAKLAARVRETEVAEVAEEAAPEVPPTEQPEPPDRPLIGEATRARAAAQMQDRRQAVTRIWKKVEDAFRGRKLGTYKLKSQLKISSARGSLEVDGLFESLNRSQVNVLLETKVALNPRSLDKVAHNFATEFLSVLARYQMTTDEVVFGWLVVIVPSEGEAELDPAATQGVTDALKARVGRFGTATVIPEAEIDSLPDLFMRQFIDE